MCTYVRRCLWNKNQNEKILVIIKPFSSELVNSVFLYLFWLIHCWRILDIPESNIAEIRTESFSGENAREPDIRTNSRSFHSQNILFYELANFFPGMSSHYVFISDSLRIFTLFCYTVITVSILLLSLS